MNRAGDHRAKSPTLVVSIVKPTRLSDIQEWVAACGRLGMGPDFTSIEIDGVHDTLRASVPLDDIDELS